MLHRLPKRRARAVVHAGTALAGWLVGIAGLGCATPSAEPMPIATRPTNGRHGPLRPRVAAVIETAATRPTTQATTRPTTQRTDGAVGSPYRLDVPTIVRLVFTRNPEVTASREDMAAAAHALEEFRANLSRLEPFAEVRTDLSDFPNRRETRTMTGEATLGIRKETFEGATLRLEGGGSASRAKIGRPDEGENPIDEGSGGLIRGRLEVPFVGSRRRQERIISQAFQESNARKARLTYLSDFRTYVLTALDYYNQTILYKDIADTYAIHVRDIEALERDPRVGEVDRARVHSVVADFQSREALYRSYQRVYVRYLLAALGLEQDDEVVLPPPRHDPDVFVERAATPEGLAGMIEEARQNNPTFRVLEDAIRDAELQRSLAVQGHFDVTAFVEGTQFPFGAETFDDRFDGWMLGGGMTVSLNDRRVLIASRRKAEANIRAFRAKSESTMNEIKRQIVTETEALHDARERRELLLDVIRQKRDEFASRSEDYLTTRRVLIDQVLGSRTDESNAELNLHNLQYSTRARVIRLEAALGTYYGMAGLGVDEPTGNGP